MLGILDWLSSFGAGMVRVALLGAWIIGAAWVGINIAQYRGPWLGWLTGILTLLFLGVMLFPAMDALKTVECKGAKYFEDCMNDEGAYEPDYP